MGYILDAARKQYSITESQIKDMETELDQYQQLLCSRRANRPSAVRKGLCETENTHALWDNENSPSFPSSEGDIENSRMLSFPLSNTWIGGTDTEMLYLDHNANTCDLVVNDINLSSSGAQPPPTPSNDLCSPTDLPSTAVSEGYTGEVSWRLFGVDMSGWTIGQVLVYVQGDRTLEPSVLD